MVSPPMTRRSFAARMLGAGPAAALGAGLAGPTAAVARGQTPAAIESGGAGSLAKLLALAPDLPPLPDQAGVQIAQFADCAAQLAAVGVASPTPGDEEPVAAWVRATWWMPLPDMLRSFALDAAWRDVFGFAAQQIDRSLVVGEPPVHVAILHGRFDERELRAAWEATGYRPIDDPAAIVYSLFEEQEIGDFSSDVTRLALSRMNNVAILPDGTLLTASRLDRLRTAIATARGDAPSLLDRADLAALVAAGDPGIAAGYLIAGAALSASDPTLAVRRGPEERAAFDDAGTMPPVGLALLGLTPGGPLPTAGDDDETPSSASADIPDAHFIVSLLLDDRADAEAAREVVAARLETGGSILTGAPYTEFFAAWDLEVAPEAPVLRIDLTIAARSPDVGFRMYVNRDLGFIFWSAD